MNQIPMTPAGHKMLQEELKNLKSVVRPKVIQDIAEARAHGDISENAEYDAAKEKQAFVEARIRDLESKVGRAQIIEPSQLSGDRVVFGATVTLFDVDADLKQTWTIVGEDEADLRNNKLSITSPMAKAMVGKSVGDQLQLQTPRGSKEYEILHITFTTQAVLS